MLADEAGAEQPERVGLQGEEEGAAVVWMGSGRREVVILILLIKSMWLKKGGKGMGLDSDWDWLG